MSHDDTAHNWAHQTGKCRNSGNLFYDGPAIYSYGRHFMIARHTKDAAGKHCVLVNNQNSSVSTNRQIRIVVNSIPHNTPIFYVVDPTSDSKTDRKNDYRQHLVNRDEALVLASRTRKPEYKVWRLRAAGNEAQKANEMTSAFKLGFRAVKIPTETPETKALLKSIAEKAKQADQRHRQTWLSGGQNFMRNPKEIAVRYMAKYREFQTSLGVRIEEKQGLAMYKMAVRCRKNKMDFNPTRRHTLNFTRLDRISASGTLRAGCHLITFTALKTAYQQYKRSLQDAA